MLAETCACTWLFCCPQWCFAPLPGTCCYCWLAELATFVFCCPWCCAPLPWVLLLLLAWSCALDLLKLLFWGVGLLVTDTLFYFCFFGVLWFGFVVVFVCVGWVGFSALFVCWFVVWGCAVVGWVCWGVLLLVGCGLGGCVGVGLLLFVVSYFLIGLDGCLSCSRCLVRRGVLCLFLSLHLYADFFGVLVGVFVVLFLRLLFFAFAPLFAYICFVLRNTCSARLSGSSWATVLNRARPQSDAELFALFILTGEGANPLQLFHLPPYLFVH